MGQLMSDTQADTKYVAKTQKVNGIPLDGDIQISVDDVDIQLSSTSNGSVGLIKNGVDQKPVQIKGLTSVAFSNVGDYATSAQGVKADTAYQKPANGIPLSDLLPTVQQSLTKADNAVPNTRSINGQVLNKDITLPTGVNTVQLVKGTTDTSIALVVNGTNQGNLELPQSKSAQATASTVANMGNMGSYGEINTGQVFRGKPVFRQDFYINFGGAANTELNFQLLAAGVVDTIVNVGGMAGSGYGTETWQIGSSTGSQYYYVRLNDGGALAYISKSTNVRNNAATYIIVEYTKK